MKTRIPYERYNPSLSVKENAELLGCSIPTIKRYIKMKGIDRKYDSSYVKWKAIKDFNSRHPQYSLRQKAEELGYSINTIRKYQALSESELDESIRDTEKISQFDIKNRNAIKSISSNQSDILLWIMSLYNGGEPFEADLTYSKGIFYKNLPQPKFKYDKFPQQDDVKPLDNARILPDSSFSSIVYDLPFIISDLHTDSIIKDRFTYFKSVEEAYSVNDDILNLSYRLLKQDGLLVVKTMDCAYAGKQYWISDYILRKAEEMGLELLDKFILTSHLRLFSKTRTQHRARKYHSYFFVFKKN